MNRCAAAILLPIALGLTLPAFSAAPAAPAAVLPQLDKPGQKIPLGGDHYFIYGFTAPAKMGSAIMRVEIFTRAGQRDTSFAVKGDVDMPAMRGAHSSGPRPFALSAKGVYLLPVSLVMPGGWEFKFIFERNGQPVFTGIHLFEI